MAGHGIGSVIQDVHEHTLSRHADGRGTTPAAGAPQRRQGGRSHDQARADPARRGRPVHRRRIARNVGVGTSTVYRTKQRFVEEGLERALSEAPRPGAPRKLGASDEALLVAIACSTPPAGRARWTMDLLAGEMVRLTTHETLSGDDGPSPTGRDEAEAVAGEDVVHSDGRTPSTSRAWKTCSISTPRRRTRGGRSSASTKRPGN